MRNVTRADIKYLWPSVLEVRDRNGTFDHVASMRKRVLTDRGTPANPIPADEVIDQFFVEITKWMEEFNYKRRKSDGALITTDDVQIVEVYLIYDDNSNRTFRDPDEIITYEEDREREHVHWAYSSDSPNPLHLDDGGPVAPGAGIHYYPGGLGGRVGGSGSQGLYQQAHSGWATRGEIDWKLLSEREAERKGEDAPERDPDALMKLIQKEKEKADAARGEAMEALVRQQVVNSDAYKELDLDGMPAESQLTDQLRNEYMNKIMSYGSGFVSGPVTDQGKQLTAMQLEIMQMKNITPPA